MTGGGQTTGGLGGHTTGGGHITGGCGGHTIGGGQITGGLGGQMIGGRGGQTMGGFGRMIGGLGGQTIGGLGNVIGGITIGGLLQCPGILKSGIEITGGLKCLWPPALAKGAAARIATRATFISEAGRNMVEVLR